jgi:hypothetical protein
VGGVAFRGGSHGARRGARGRRRRRTRPPLPGRGLKRRLNRAAPTDRAPDSCAVAVHLLSASTTAQLMARRIDSANTATSAGGAGRRGRRGQGESSGARSRWLLEQRRRRPPPDPGRGAGPASKPNFPGPPRVRLPPHPAAQRTRGVVPFRELLRQRAREDGRHVLRHVARRAGALVAVADHEHRVAAARRGVGVVHINHILWVVGGGWWVVRVGEGLGWGKGVEGPRVEAWAGPARRRGGARAPRRPRARGPRCAPQPRRTAAASAPSARRRRGAAAPAAAAPRSAAAAAAAARAARRGPALPRAPAPAAPPT